MEQPERSGVFGQTVDCLGKLWIVGQTTGCLDKSWIVWTNYGLFGQAMNSFCKLWIVFTKKRLLLITKDCLGKLTNGFAFFPRNVLLNRILLTNFTWNFS